jgi:pyridoxal phosphate phosphatase PHOSPHO2
MKVYPLLVAFDFDSTIINGNSDLIVQKLISSDKITEDVKMHRKDGWTVYMQEIFCLLHKNGVTPQQIQDTIAHIPAIPGMDTLIRYFYKNNADIIIISDANSVFIKDWLSYSSLTHIVKRVFTNHAGYDEDGCLKIAMYHTNDSCQLCTKNMCKGYVLDSFLEERASLGEKYLHIMYIGDGRNDLCPSLRLSEKDVVFPRKGFQLDGLIRDMQNHKDMHVKATVHTWATGYDIIRDVKDCLEEISHTM